MRPTATPQSAVRAPLNDVLGREANVRVLRVLALAETPLSRAELCSRTALNSSGVPRVLRHLEEWGVIEFIGSGHGKRSQLRPQHRISDALRELFRAEQRRTDDLISWLRTAVGLIRPIPSSAWIEGPFVAGNDGLHEPLVVGILSEDSATSKEGIRDHMRDQLRRAQSTFDVVLEIRILDSFDVRLLSPEERQRLSTVIGLIGPAPLDLLGIDVPPYPALGDAHGALEGRSLRIGKAIAHRLTTDRELVPATTHWIERRLPTASAGERRTLEEWYDLLTSSSPAQLRAFLMSSSERAVRLLRSQPFIAVLSDEARHELLSEADALR